MFRARRMRSNQAIRDMVRENHLNVKDFIYPLFVEEGENICKEISSMPGIFRYSIDRIDQELKEIVDLGIPSIMLFGIPAKKDAIPMCGVPHHAAEGYIKTLVDQGHKVAICEQVEDPKVAKGVVKREVVQVVTPGTVMESSMLKEKESNKSD